MQDVLELNNLDRDGGRRKPSLRYAGQRVMRSLRMSVVSTHVDRLAKVQELLTGFMDEKPNRYKTDELEEEDIDD